MSAVSNLARTSVRSQQLSKTQESGSDGADSKETGQSASTNASGAGNGVLLRTLDSNSRRSALPQEHEAHAEKSDTSESYVESSESQPGSTSHDKAAVNTAIATDSSGTEAANSAIANDSSGLEAVKSALENNLKEMASDPKAFHAALKKSFGENYDQAKAETIRQQVLNDDFSWMPEIKVVDESVLQDQSGTQGAGEGFGAYSKENDTIYISKQLLESDPEKATNILTEEVGHGLDARLNTSDAAGDEGDIFARLVSGEEISESQLSALKAENDSGTIIVDGKEVEVEYGFFKKLGKAISKPFKAVKKAITKPFKAIKKGLSKVWKGIKKGFKKLMESKVFSAILMVAQFIPIPIVQVVVRVINIVKAAYQVAQGIKHGSVGMVLGGVAGVAGGVGGAGKLLGASAKFVKTASNIANGARAASAGYQALAKGNFEAAAGLASNYFGGSDTGLGRTLGAAGQAYGAVNKAKDGDILGAFQSGQAAYNGFTGADAANSEATDKSEGASPGAETRSTGGIQGFIDNVKGNKTYKAIVENASTIRNIVKAAKDGEISDATQSFLTNYADDLGIGSETQDTIIKWAGVVEKVNDTKELIVDGKYSAGIGEAAELLGISLSENNRKRLDTVFQLRDSVVGDKYADASRKAGSLALQSGQPDLAANFLRLANLLDGKLPTSSDQPAVSDAA